MNLRICALSILITCGTAIAQDSPFIRGMESGIRMREQQERIRLIQAETDRVRLENERLKRETQAPPQPASPQSSSVVTGEVISAFAALRARYADVDAYGERMLTLAREFSSARANPEFTYEKYLEGLYLITKYASPRISAALLPSAAPVSSASFTRGLLLTGDHSIKQVAASGKLVILEDKSVWEVQPLDRFYTSLWLPVTDVIVSENRESIGDYKFFLINKDTGEQAAARFLTRE